MKNCENDEKLEVNCKDKYSMEQVHSNKLAVLWRRYSTALYAGAAISCGLTYLMDAGYTRAAAVLSVVSLGGAGLYYFYNRQEKLVERDLVVITGCNSGLGYSLALHCRAQGATVLAAVHGVSHTENPNAAVEALKREGIIVCFVDITIQNSVQKFINKVKSVLEEQPLVLRALVNNAGIMVFGEFEWQTQDQVENQVNVNLLGTMRLTREMMPILRENGSRIIVISSHCAIQPLPGTSVYGATKAALEAWATSLRVEIGKYGIKVVSFTPGGFISESSIMMRQHQYFKKMENCMSNEVKQFYGNYFFRFAEYFSQFSKANLSSLPLCVKIVSDPRIYETFDNALLDIYPSSSYRCEPWRYMFYRIIFESTPTWMRDIFVQRFVNAPSWQTDKQ